MSWKGIENALVAFIFLCLVQLIAVAVLSAQMGVTQATIAELETRIKRLESTRKADLTIFDRSWQE
jgi:C4-dicarboxylate transporter